MSKIWVTSDHHFLHENINVYCNRPKNCNELMFKSWNEMIHEDDIIFHLGDLSAGLKGREDKLKKIIQNLNGKKYLAIGNHDHCSEEFYKDCGFIDVQDYYRINGVFMNHYPILEDKYDKLHMKELKSKMREVAGTDLVIHGHKHLNDGVEFKNHFNVAVDRHNYRPVLLSELINKTKKEQ